MPTDRKRKKRKILRYCARVIRFPNPQLLSTDCKSRFCRCGVPPSYNDGGYNGYDDGTGDPPEFTPDVVPDWVLESPIIPTQFVDCAALIVSNGGQPYSSQPGWMSNSCWSWWQGFTAFWQASGEDIWAAHYANPVGTLPNLFEGTFIVKIRYRIYGGSAGALESFCKNSTLHPTNPEATDTPCRDGYACEGCDTGEFPPLVIVEL